MEIEGERRNAETLLQGYARAPPWRMGRLVWQAWAWVARIGRKGGWAGCGSQEGGRAALGVGVALGDGDGFGVKLVGEPSH